jgi:hypothetical protein
MSSWRVQIKSSGGDKTTLDLIDALGPLNDWSCSTPGAFVPSRGTFTNQMNVVVDTAPPSWRLEGFDIDSVAVGDSGAAVVDQSGGTFPLGNMRWAVVAEL